MKIEGLGQVNSLETLRATRAQTDTLNETESFQSTLQKAFDEGDKKELKKACDEFEGVMLKMLYKQMKATVPDGGFIEKSSARSIFEDMLDDALMEQSSERGMGISDMMYKQLSAKMDKTYKLDGAESVEK